MDQLRSVLGIRKAQELAAVLLSPGSLAVLAYGPAQIEVSLRQLPFFWMQAFLALFSAMPRLSFVATV